MKPAAQIQAAIELLELIDEQKMPADRLMAKYFRDHRYIGSKDKATISEWLYLTLRRKAMYAWLAEQIGLPVEPRVIIAVAVAQSDLVVTEMFNGVEYAPKKLSHTEKTALTSSLSLIKLDAAPDWVRLNIPEWLVPKLQHSLGDMFEAEMLALQDRATTDIRVNTLKTTRESLIKELESQGFSPQPTPLSPNGLRFSTRVSLFNQNSFKNGWFEVQDEGSQLIATVCDVKPGMRVVDFCAGAGGKTLALSAMMENKGVLHACDVHSKRLQNLTKRTKRAGVHNVQVHLLSSERDKWVKRNSGKMDIVLIDAPCTGTGTWRRNPDAKWSLQNEDLQNLMKIQNNILESAARLLKPGGKLFYATCSLLENENEQQVEQFLSENRTFSAASITNIDGNNDLYQLRNHQLRTFPAKSAMDGFFVAALVKN